MNSAYHTMLYDNICGGNDFVLLHKSLCKKYRICFCGQFGVSYSYLRRLD